MDVELDQARVLDFVVYELRLLLADHLGKDSDAEPSVKSAAHLVYALHNQALAALEGKSFEIDEAIKSMDAAGQVSGVDFVQRLRDVAGWNHE